MKPILEWAFLGRVPYEKALALQFELREGVRRGERHAALLLLEHDPVITLGKSAELRDVLLSPAELERRGVACVRIGRGGQVTYHGPGQLVGYPIRPVRRAVRAHICAIVQALVGYLATLGIEAHWDEESPGVWTSAGKIGAVGVDARRGVATHGFALNISTRLDDFRMIVPCGSTRPVTSIEALTGRRVALDEAARAIADRLAQRFEMTPSHVDRHRFEVNEALAVAANAPEPPEVGGQG